jgi:integrase
MKALISEALLKKLTATDVEVHDSKLVGFVIRCRPSGSHAYRYRLGRGQWVTLGRVGQMSPDEARAAAESLRGSVSKKALATVAEEGSVTLGDAIKSARAQVQAARRHKKTGTWKGYLDEAYGPHIVATLKRGAEDLARLRVHFAEFNDLRLKDITPFAIERWRSGRLKAGVKPATINRDLAALRGALSRAVQWELLAGHPMRKLEPLSVDRGGVVRFLSADEEAALREALEARDTKRREARATANAWRRERGYPEREPFGTYTDHLTPLVLLALNSGARRGELLALRWADVNLPASRLTIRGLTDDPAVGRLAASALDRRQRTDNDERLAVWIRRGADVPSGVGLRTGHRSPISSNRQFRRDREAAGPVGKHANHRGDTAIDRPRQHDRPDEVGMGERPGQAVALLP